MCQSKCTISISPYLPDAEVKRQKVMLFIQALFSIFRNLQLGNVGEEVVDGVRAVRLAASPDTFNFSAPSSSSSSSSLPERCVSRKHQASSASSFSSSSSAFLPAGAMDLGPCCEGAPFAASFPHFLHGAKW